MLIEISFAIFIINDLRISLAAAGALSINPTLYNTTLCGIAVTDNNIAAYIFVSNNIKIFLIKIISRVFVNGIFASVSSNKYMVCLVVAVSG